MADGGMTDVDEVRHMTTDEIALMREIVLWRRNHDVDFVRRRIYGSPYWTEYRTRRQVWFHHREGVQLYVSRPAELGHESWGVQATSLTEAVDLLVAYGFLPPRFSSTYRAGWHAAHVWYDSEGVFPSDGDEFKRLFHDPENISFPAGVDE
jgi:hypothetical protein